MTQTTMTYRQNVPRYCAISFFRTHLDVFRRALLGDLLARVEPMTVRRQPGSRAVWVTSRASPIAYIAGDDNCWAYLLSRG